MRMMKQMALLLCLLLAFALASGCGAKKEASASMIGVWTLTDMTGSDDAVQSMQYYNAMGMKISMAISKDQLEMVTTMGTESDYEVVSYRIEGTQLITEANAMDYVVDGNTLKLTTGGVTMVFTRN